nr:unnamed protein product [Callosobruchus chinensis]
MENYFYDFDELSGKLHIWDKKTNELGQKVSFRDSIKWITIDEFGSYLYEESLDEYSPFHKVNLLKKVVLNNKYTVLIAMEVNVTPCPEGSRTRKPKKMPATWKRNQEKARRHASKGFPVPPRCSRDAGAFQCKTLKMQEIRRFHQNFYSNRTKIDQDRFLIKYI